MRVKQEMGGARGNSEVHVEFWETNGRDNSQPTKLFYPDSVVSYVFCVKKYSHLHCLSKLYL